jgi:hypothetical protein
MEIEYCMSAGFFLRQSIKTELRRNLLELEWNKMGCKSLSNDSVLDHNSEISSRPNRCSRALSKDLET